MQQQNSVGSSSKVEPCNICGDVGFSEFIVTCSECHINREHSYCTRVQHIEVPEVWLCEPCQSKNNTTSPSKVNQDIGVQAPKRQETARRGKVKFLDKDEVIKLSSRNFHMTKKTYIRCKYVFPKIHLPTVKSNPCISVTVHGMLQRNEAKKNQMSIPITISGPTKEHRNVSDRQVGAPIRDRKVQFLDLHEENPLKRLVRKPRMSIPILGSGDVVQCHQSNIEKETFEYSRKPPLLS